MVGRIVCSKAGSDKGSFLVVLNLENGRVMVADGKRYKIASPKRKNQKHLAFTNKVLNSTEFTTDKSLRQAIAIYRSNIK